MHFRKRLNLGELGDINELIHRRYEERSKPDSNHGKSGMGEGSGRTGDSDRATDGGKKKRNLGGKELRKAIGKQLRYLRRDLGHIETLAERSTLEQLSRREYRDLLVIGEVYRQQSQMYEQGVKRIDDIDSEHQPAAGAADGEGESRGSGGVWGEDLGKSG